MQLCVRDRWHVYGRLIHEDMDMATNDTAENGGRALRTVSAVPLGTTERARISMSRAQRNVLQEAREILQEPSRNTKRKILISINLILGILFSVHVAIQLATVGHLPDPPRDNLLM